MTLPGWPESLHGTADPGALPAAFARYVKTLEELVETRVAIISTGVERTQTVFLESELAGFVDLGRVRAGLAA
jgi:adenylosuccinate synthase